MLSPAVSQLGSALYILGQNWLVVRSTGTTSLLGIIEAVGGVGFFLGDLFIGELVDHHNRKKVLLWTDLLSAVICFFGSFLINNESPQAWLLILMTFTLNFLFTINYPAAKSMAPEIMAGSRLQRFNALANMVFNFANIISPLIGGLLLSIKSIDFSEFVLINAASFLVAAFLNFLIQYSWPQDNVDRSTTSFVQDIANGFKYVFKNKNLFQFILSMAIFNFCSAGCLLIAPYIGNHFFGGKAVNYSIFLAVSAIGGLIGGSLLAIQKQAVSSQTLYREIILEGLSLLVAGLFLPNSLIVWFILAFIIGLIQSRFFSISITLIQKETEIAYLGRIFGLTFLFFDGIQPLGSLIFGYLINSWRQYTYSFIGAMLLLFFCPFLLHNKNKQNKNAAV
ncbi:MAG: MFS transporter [Oenococcus sp.]|uniref:MFS transporter n=1 Tax=Oenococcus sp. TaxID=1979414 RepID=UPI0039ED8655